MRNERGEGVVRGDGEELGRKTVRKVRKEGGRIGLVRMGNKHWKKGEKKE